MKLTDRQVHGFPLIPDGRREVTDDAVPGLSIRIGKTAKTFRLVIGTGDDRKRFTIGTYDPPRFTLAMAREKARTIAAQERLRIDGPPAYYLRGRARYLLSRAPLDFAPRNRGSGSRRAAPRRIRAVAISCPI